MFKQKNLFFLLVKLNRKLKIYKNYKTIKFIIFKHPIKLYKNFIHINSNFHFI